MYQIHVKLHLAYHIYTILYFLSSYHILIYVTTYHNFIYFSYYYLESSYSFYIHIGPQSSFVISSHDVSLFIDFHIQ